MTYQRDYALGEPTREHVDALTGVSVIEFGAPWCSHCMAAQPALFQQVIIGLEKLGPQAFKNRHELENAAGATVFEAKASGLTRIEHVMQSRNSTGLFAVQGAPNDPTHLRIHLDKAQATAEPIEKSTVQLQQETGIAMHMQPLERQQHRSMGL